MGIQDRAETGRWTVLAHLLRPQGRKGEILAELVTDFPERFGERTRVYLAKVGFTGDPGAARQMTVTSFWLPVGKNAGRVVLGFEGISSINDAGALGGLELIVPAADRVALDEDAEYISDLLGCVVLDGERRVGVVHEVSFPSTPDGLRRLDDAAPLLTVHTEDAVEVLIPYVREFLVAVDVVAKRIEMRLPEGLVELNR